MLHNNLFSYDYLTSNKISVIKNLHTFYFIPILTPKDMPVFFLTGLSNNFTALSRGPIQHNLCRDPATNSGGQRTTATHKLQLSPSLYIHGYTDIGVSGM